MDADQASKVLGDMRRHLVSKGRLVLTVDVRTEEEADQIMQWMYGTEKPMKAALHEVTWDKATVPTAVAEAVETIRAALAR